MLVSTMAALSAACSDTNDSAGDDGGQLGEAVTAEGCERDPLCMRIAFGTDERTELSDHVRRLLLEGGHEVEEAGDGDPWPDVGRRVGELVASQRCQRGVVCCWTGTGVSMAANKVPGVRAALCTDAETARGARRWNDANVLAFGLRLTSPTVAGEMIEAFLKTGPDAAEAANIAKLT
ncbi:MAG TPA: RpiB/LacA/LacB family sugar-phosphate isomerase [Acidimicrobiales bacterium]|nr:RpiB/LacA/LacB family sugar-phosphate isomerase [Acidimicrobiales bacterium]